MPEARLQRTRDNYKDSAAQNRHVSLAPLAPLSLAPLTDAERYQLRYRRAIDATVRVIYPGTVTANVIEGEQH